MEIQSNDNTSLEPITAVDGPVLEFDFPSFKIGISEYSEGPTGCTVFYFPNGAATAVDIRGGTVGVLGNHPWNHAICLAGGSFYGLEAASGVAAEIFAQKNFSSGFNDIARVSAGVIYDYPGRSNAIYPDKRLGREALKSVRPGVFPMGARGAGCSATVGKSLDFKHAESGGQGGAFRQYGQTKVAVFSVVSAMGAIVDRRGRVVRGHLNQKTGQRSNLLELLEQRDIHDHSPEAHQGNSTLTVVITNQKLDASALSQMAKQVHSSMARVIQPFHTIFDGDVLYAVTTDEVENKRLNKTVLGALASEAAWDAVLSILETT